MGRSARGVGAGGGSLVADDQWESVSTHAITSPGAAELLATSGMLPAAPGPRDYVVLVRGVPVAPWIGLRPAAEVWALWLSRLQDLCAGWRELVAAPETLASGARDTWEAWQRTHVISVQVRHAHQGVRRLASLLAGLHQAQGEAHLIGHSVGGAAVLAYLAQWRAGACPPPRLRVQAAVTLDAALDGLAGIWSGATRSLPARARSGLEGLGAWAAQQGIAVLMVANERDWWSHRAVGDLPYLGLRPEQPFSLRAQLDGTMHGWLRRLPELVEALWSGET